MMLWVSDVEGELWICETCSCVDVNRELQRRTESAYVVQHVGTFRRADF